MFHKREDRDSSVDKNKSSGVHQYFNQQQEFKLGPKQAAARLRIQNKLKGKYAAHEDQRSKSPVIIQN